MRPSRFVFGFVSVQSLSVTANYKAECEKWCIWIITTVGLFDKILGSTNVTFIRLAERKVFYVLFLIPWVYCGEKFMKRKILHYFIVWQLSISLLLECISFLFWAELQQLDDKTFLELLQKNADNIYRIAGPGAEIEPVTLEIVSCSNYLLVCGEFSVSHLAGLRMLRLAMIFV